MSTSAPVLEDNSFLSRFDRFFYRIESLLALISGLAILGLMFLAVISAGGRNFFNTPLSGYVDWIEYSMPFIAIFGIAYCQRQGGHIRMDLIVGHLHGRVLWLLEWITTFGILIFILLLTRGSWAHFERSFDWNSPLWSRDSSLDIGLPLWPAKLVVPIAFAILSIRLFAHLWGYGRAFIENSERPIAVPLIVDVVTQAAQESESVSDGSEKECGNSSEKNQSIST